jgi:hypothetical protein
VLTTGLLQPAHRTRTTASASTDSNGLCAKWAYINSEFKRQAPSVSCIIMFLYFRFLAPSQLPTQVTSNIVHRRQKRPRSITQAPGFSKRGPQELSAGQFLECTAKPAIYYINNSSQWHSQHDTKQNQLQNPSGLSPPPVLLCQVPTPERGEQHPLEGKKAYARR